MRFRPLFSIFLVGLMACQAPLPPTPQSGIWQVSLQLREGVTLPFRLEIQAEQWLIYNGEERLVVTDIQRKDDSLFVTMPIFDSEFHLQIEDAQNLRGQWYHYSRGRDYRIPFQASYGEQARFSVQSPPEFALAERWRVVFSDGIPGEEYPAIGLFHTNGEQVWGTFLTETGDYRYLEGVLDGKQLKLSCFDGSHAFLFEAELGPEDTLKGTFWSGNHWIEPWWGVADPEAELRTPEALTYLKEGYTQLDFQFPNLSGQEISLSDERYQGKVVIVQIMGSWCPNCLDETKLYQQWYERYHEQGLEIIGLAFERSQGDRLRAQAMVQRLKDKLEIPYELLIAATEDDKTAAGEKLPMLNHILSYPTSIFIDRQGQVRNIHTGFNGPGTGVYFSRYVEEYEAFLEKLLSDSPETGSVAPGV